MGFMDSQVLVALALSLVGGFSTSLGALFVIINPSPNLKMLGLLQGFAAGLMMSISFLDLAHNAINSIGFLRGNLWVRSSDKGLVCSRKNLRPPPDIPYSRNGTNADLHSNSLDIPPFLNLQHESITAN